MPIVYAVVGLKMRRAELEADMHGANLELAAEELRLAHDLQVQKLTHEREMSQLLMANQQASNEREIISQVVRLVAPNAAMTDLPAVIDSIKGQDVPDEASPSLRSRRRRASA